MTGIKIKEYMIILIIISAAAIMIWAGAESAAGIKQAFYLCINVMIPSLFSFTVISKLLVSTNVYSAAAGPFSLITRYLFRMPDEFMAVFIISQIAGYPIGASIISRMHNDGIIDRETAENMLCFCIAPGPPYIMTVANICGSEDEFLWLKMFAAISGANIIAVLVTAPFRSVPPKKQKEVHIRLDSSVFISSVQSGAETMMTICAMIMFMAALLEAVGKTGLTAAITIAVSKITGSEPIIVYPYVRSFFEISNLTLAGANTPLNAAMLSFGGLCVHMQIKALCTDFSTIKAVFFRLPCAVMAYLICRILAPKTLYFNAISVISHVNLHIGKNQPIMSVFLVIMTILIISKKTMVKIEKT